MNTTTIPQEKGVGGQQELNQRKDARDKRYFEGPANSGLVL